MPRFMRVPWVRWQSFRIQGVVREHESGRPLAKLLVKAFDKDVIRDDFLGACETDESGAFEIRFTDADFKDALESHPDLYLCVFAPGLEEPIHDTTCEIRHDASQDEFFEIEIPKAALPAPA